MGDRLGQLNAELEAHRADLERRVAERTDALRASQAREIQQEKMAAFGLLAAGIAHEVGNPLAALSSLVQMLQRRDPDPYTAEKLELAARQLGRIQRTIRELVDFSRPASSAVARVRPAEVVEEALGIAKYYHRTKQREITTTLAPDLPAVRAVRDHLTQVVLNLVLNAIDATGMGGRISRGRPRRRRLGRADDRGRRPGDRRGRPGPALPAVLHDQVARDRAGPVRQPADRRGDGGHPDLRAREPRARGRRSRSGSPPSAPGRHGRSTTPWLWSRPWRRARARSSPPHRPVGESGWAGASWAGVRTTIPARGGPHEPTGQADHGRALDAPSGGRSGSHPDRRRRGRDRRDAPGVPPGRGVRGGHRPRRAGGAGAGRAVRARPGALRRPVAGPRRPRAARSAAPSPPRDPGDDDHRLRHGRERRRRLPPRGVTTT